MSAGRFDRQIRFAPLGAAGQERLARARVLVVGCGALGGALAQSMARSGVGFVRIVDRDVVEESNLPRQVLFEPPDLGQPKAQVAARALQRIGGPTRVEPHVRHLDAEAIAIYERLLPMPYQLESDKERIWRNLAILRHPRT